MKTSINNWLRCVSALAMTCGCVGLASAGPIFLTGHDPDFHAQPGQGNGEKLLRAGLNFVTGGTYNDTNPATKPFLWVESTISVPGGHLRGANALTNPLGLTAGTQFDVVNAAGLAGVNFSNYSAIAIASSFGGTLTRAELDALIARKADIVTFVNAGGGIFASAECFPCGANLLGGATPPSLFGFLPVTVTSIGANGPFTVTAFGSSTFGLANGDLNDPTHNSFGLVGGLNVVEPMPRAMRRRLRASSTSETAASRLPQELRPSLPAWRYCVRRSAASDLRGDAALLTQLKRYVTAGDGPRGKAVLPPASLLQC